MKLEVIDAQCGYEKNKPVQSNINFTANTGEIICVLGPNGCGKSTVFKSILGLLDLQKGKVLINGEDISKWSAGKLADTMAYVSQAHNPPFPYQVKDVILFGRISKIGVSGQPSDKDYELVENAMVDMGIEHLRDEAYSNISGGELQLVMIARALVQQPQFLVLDEPTAALDYGNVVRVIEKIRSLAQKGYGIIMTTHSPDHAFMCNSKVALLQKNAQMKFGRAIDIITEKNMKQAYGVNVNIVEFINTHNEIMRTCSPLF